MSAGATLVFTTSSGLLSRAVRWFTKSRASHVAIGFNLYGLPALLHANVGGVQVTPRKKFCLRNRVVAEYRFRIDIRGALPDAVSLLGEDYDYVGLLGFVPVMLFRWLGKRIKNPWARPSAVVCSEFALTLGQHAAIPEWYGLDPERTTPADLLDLCETSQATFECLMAHATRRRMAS